MPKVEMKRGCPNLQVSLEGALSHFRVKLLGIQGIIANMIMPQKLYVLHR